MEDKALIATIVAAIIFTAGDVITTMLFIGNGIEEGSLVPSLTIAGFGIMGLIVFKSVYLGIILLVIFFLNRNTDLKMFAGGFATILLVTGMVATVNNILTFTVQSFHGLQFWIFVPLIFFLSILLNAEWGAEFKKGLTGKVFSAKK